MSKTNLSLIVAVAIVGACGGTSSTWTHSDDAGGLIAVPGRPFSTERGSIDAESASTSVDAGEPVDQEGGLCAKPFLACGGYLLGTWKILGTCLDSGAEPSLADLGIASYRLQGAVSFRNTQFELEVIVTTETSLTVLGGSGRECLATDPTRESCAVDGAACRCSRRVKATGGLSSSADGSGYAGVSVCVQDNMLAFRFDRDDTLALDLGSLWPSDGGMHSPSGYLRAIKVHD